MHELSRSIEFFATNVESAFADLSHKYSHEFVLVQTLCTTANRKRPSADAKPSRSTSQINRKRIYNIVLMVQSSAR